MRVNTFTDGPITKTRRDLSDLIRKYEDYFTVYDGIPGSLHPPCITITEGSPLLEADEKSYTTGRVHFDITLIAPPTDNEFAISRLDAAVDRVLSYLWQYFMVTVDAYQSVTTADSQSYLACVMHVSAPATIELAEEPEPELPPEYIPGYAPQPDDML